MKKKLDETRSVQLVSPRRKGSTWSKVNKDRVARLEADGLITAAGQAVIDAAKESGTWALLDQASALIVRPHFRFPLLPPSTLQGRKNGKGEKGEKETEKSNCRGASEQEIRKEREETQNELICSLFLFPWNKVPDDLAEAFDAHAPAREHWDAFPKSIRRGILVGLPACLLLWLTLRRVAGVDCAGQAASDAGEAGDGDCGEGAAERACSPMDPEG